MKAVPHNNNVQLHASIVVANDSRKTQDRLKIIGRKEDGYMNADQSDMSDLEIDLYNLKFVDSTKNSQKSYTDQPKSTFNIRSKLKSLYFQSFKAVMAYSKTSQLNLSKSVKFNGSVNPNNQLKNLKNMQISKNDTTHTTTGDSKLKSSSKAFSEFKWCDKSNSPTWFNDKGKKVEKKKGKNVQNVNKKLSLKVSPSILKKFTYGTFVLIKSVTTKNINCMTRQLVKLRDELRSIRHRK